MTTNNSFRKNFSHNRFCAVFVLLMIHQMLQKILIPLIVLMGILNVSLVYAVDLQGASFELRLKKQASDQSYTDMDETEQIQFFNEANCVCDTTFGVQITLRDFSGNLLDSKPVEVWTGTHCDDTTNIETRNSRCELIETITDINSLKTSTVIPITTKQLMNPNEATCNTTESTRSIYLLVDDDADAIYENIIALDITTDSEPPPLPTNININSGEQGLFVTWTLSETNLDDVDAIQLLCVRADDSNHPRDNFPRSDNAYQSPNDLCGKALQRDTAVPSNVFACTEKLGSTETSFRINELENHVPYRVMLATIDARKNASVFDIGINTPRPSIDFWEEYNDQGGQLSGLCGEDPRCDTDSDGTCDCEFCFIATASFGNYNHPFVRVFRRFRDNTLATSDWGKKLVQFYYTHSPSAALFIQEHSLARIAAIILLTPLMILVAIWEYVPIFFVFLCLALLILRNCLIEEK